MDGPREHYAKWNKSVRERQIPWFLSYVEFHEQTELTRKRETDSEGGGWQLVGGGRLGGGGIERKGKRTHGHEQQWGDCSGEGCIRGINGNGN